MIKAGIIGATGYAGGELVRILTGHKDVEIKWYGSRSYIDKKYAEVYQNMFQIVDDKCMDDNMEALADEVDVIFTATPQGLCACLVNEEILAAADLRSRNPGRSVVDVEEKGVEPGSAGAGRWSAPVVSASVPGVFGHRNEAYLVLLSLHGAAGAGNRVVSGGTDTAAPDRGRDDTGSG